ncbi:GTP-binding protein LepA C-terminus [Rhizoctonia solani]|uniref:GTP-binding protein LepA C-terminus n=1 Tax=Rhizoctonia solani TaxID=456999 RepID=A0A8H8P8Q0_9AGAM|nr:GTP-binding protein LepA C-terminus [Rhizoctonia solani]QRW27616.1 GTP-binding protein LepA C-terminus [Rhizoctonia solani]
MLYTHNGKQYLLNLIDTPGHVDFSWEVSRSMAACQGALLLVDATRKGEHWYMQSRTITRDKIASCHTRKRYDVVDIGIMHPEEESTGILQAGQVGYITCNMKDSNEAHIGDTLHHAGEQVDPLPGFRPAKAMVFAGVYPVDSNEFPKLEESVKRKTSTELNHRYRSDSTIPTGPPQRQRKKVSNPVDFPDPGEVGTSSGSTVREIEPIVHATIIVPEDYIGNMLDLCSAHRATDLTHAYLSDADSRIVIRATLPLSEIVTDFHDRVKHRSSGFASFDYEAAGYARADVVKVGFALNGKPVDALALIVDNDKATRLGRAWVKKLKEVVPKQLFEIAIQATIGSKVIARETLSAQRKDVTAGLYGGHYERKMKVLNKQKEGKKKMKKIGNVELPQEAFYDVLSSKIE